MVEQKKNGGQKAGIPTAATAPTTAPQPAAKIGDEWVAVQAQIEGWFVKEPGKPAIGTVRGRFERGDGKGAYYLLQLTQPIRAALAQEQTADLPAGAFLAVGESHGLRTLAECEGCRVRIEAVRKAETRSGNSVWIWDVRVHKDDERIRGANIARGARAEAAAAPQADQADQIPF
jgi:hypothetical protein